jgi:hypothetical protein
VIAVESDQLYRVPNIPYKTVLSELECESPRILNALITSHDIERKVLVETVEEGSKIVFNDNRDRDDTYVCICSVCLFFEYLFVLFVCFLDVCCVFWLKLLKRVLRLLLTITEKQRTRMFVFCSFVRFCLFFVFF